MEVEFRLQEYLHDVVAEPYRAATNIPKWFKDLKPDIDQVGEFPVGTAKRCLPMLDSMTAGYIIPMPVAVHAFASEDGEEIYFNWQTSPDFTAVDGHSMEQAPTLDVTSIHKWINPWSIITPPGYSCLFTTPFNRPELPFECFTGIVDTDTYHNQVNFPFYWKKFPYDGVINQGEPMIQVVPFKREEFGMNITYLGEKDSQALHREGLKVQADYHHYKSKHHNKKVWSARGCPVTGDSID